MTNESSGKLEPTTPVLAGCPKSDNFEFEALFQHDLDKEMNKSNLSEAIHLDPLGINLLKLNQNQVKPNYIIYQNFLIFKYKKLIALFTIRSLFHIMSLQYNMSNT